MKINFCQYHYIKINQVLISSNGLVFFAKFSWTLAQIRNSIPPILNFLKQVDIGRYSIKLSKLLQSFNLNLCHYGSRPPLTAT